MMPESDSERGDFLGYDATASALTGKPAPPDRPPSEMVEPARSHRATEPEGEAADPLASALAHGPQVFQSAEEALRYCESNVSPRPGEL